MSNQPLVCNVKGFVKLPDQKLSPMQPVPKATDLPSALKAIQAITNNFNTLMNGGNFVEDRSRRTFTINRVFNPSDATQWVDVQQITGLVFVDPVTGRSIVWRQ